jgi:hypothetical protein
MELVIFWLLNKLSQASIDRERLFFKKIFRSERSVLLRDVQFIKVKHIGRYPRWQIIVVSVKEVDQPRTIWIPKPGFFGDDSRTQYVLRYAAEKCREANLSN